MNDLFSVADLRPFCGDIIRDMNKRHNRRNQDVYDAETGSCASAVGVQETGTDGHTTKYTAQRYLTTVFDIHGDTLEYKIFAAK